MTWLLAIFAPSDLVSLKKRAGFSTLIYLRLYGRRSCLRWFLITRVVHFCLKVHIFLEYFFLNTLLFVKAKSFALVAASESFQLAFLRTIDCLLYRKINPLEDTIIIQDDLIKLQQWGDKWLMCFNPECEVLRVTAKKKTLTNRLQHPRLRTIGASCNEIHESSSFDSQLSFNYHIDNVA